MSKKVARHIGRRVALFLMAGSFLCFFAAGFIFWYGPGSTAQNQEDAFSNSGKVAGVSIDSFGNTVDARGKIKGVVSPEEADSLVFRIKTVFNDTVSLGEALVTGNLEVGGDSVVDGDATVVGNSTLDGDVTVSGNSNFAGTVSIDGNLVVQGGEVEASNVIYSVLTGSGLTLSGNQNITLTNSDLGSSQNIFKNFKIESTTLSANSNDDTLTFTGGAGVSLSNDGKTITIAADSNELNVSGWDVGTGTVFLTTSTDNVGIGTTSPTSKLDVVGGLKVSSGATINSGINNTSGGITNAGVITGGTGFTSSGTITLSGLSTGVLQSSFGGVLSSGALNIAGGGSYVTGILPVTNGGTGLNTVTAGDLLYASGADTLASLGIGGDGQVLTVSGGTVAWGSAGGSGPCATCLITDPGTTQVITPSAATATGLSIKQASSGSVDVFNVTSFDGSTKYFRVDSSGNVLLGSGVTSAMGNLSISPTGSDPIVIAPFDGFNAAPFSGTVTSEDLTADRTWTFPNESGVVCLATGNCAGTSAGIGGSGTTGYLTKWTDTYTVGASVLYDNGTNIGIGTATPTSKLHVVGTVNLNGVTTIGAALTASSTLNVTGTATLSSSLQVDGSTDLNDTLEVTGVTTLGSTLGVTGQGTFGGNVGIGSLSPSQALDVLGAMRFGTAGAYNTLNTSAAVSGPTGDLYWGDRSVCDSSGNCAGTSAGLGGSGTTNYLAKWSSTYGLGNSLVFDNGTNVGIGSTSPTATLDVVGSLRLNDGSYSAPSLTFRTNSDAGFYEEPLGGGYVAYASGGQARYFFTANSLSGRDTGSFYLLRAPGDATTPTFSFVGDTNTGMARATADELTLITGGSERLRVNASGNVGIGTSAPLGKFDVQGAAVGKALVILNETGNQAIFAASASGATKFLIANNGNVGIGSTSPGYSLDTVGTTRLQGTTTGGGNGLYVNDDSQVGIGGTPVAFHTLTVDTSSSSWPILFNTDSSDFNNLLKLQNSSSLGADRGSKVEFLGTSGVITGYTGIALEGASYDNSYMAFATRGSGTVAEQMRINSSGNIGIGTTAPLGKLNLEGAAVGKALAILNETGDQALFTASASGATKFVIANDGNVGIGTTTANAQLDVNGTIYFGSQIVARDDTNTKFVFGNDQIELQAGGLRLLTLSESGSFTGDVTGNLNKHNVDFNWFGDTNSDFFTLDAGAENVGIGTATPGQKLDVVGSARFSAVGSGSYSADLNLTADGTLTTSSSDIRLKENFKELNDAEILSKVLTLKTYKFDWISGGQSDIGMIAQEVQSIFPEITFTNATDGYMGINYSRLPSLLVNAIQEQQSQINNISLKIDAEGQVLGQATNVAVIQEPSVEESLLPYAEISPSLWKFLQEVVFTARTSFQSSVEFMKDVAFKGAVTLNADTVGRFVVPAGATRVRVSFTTRFKQIPTVYLSVRSDVSGGYTLELVDATGFVVVLEQGQPDAVVIDWLALLSAGDGAAMVQVLESKPISTSPEPTPVDVIESTPSPTPIPSPSSTPTSTPTPSASPSPTDVPASSTSAIVTP